MPISTAMTNTPQSDKGATVANGIMFYEGWPTQSPLFKVTEHPVNLIGQLPDHHSVEVWRVYSEGIGDNCMTVPDVQVMCNCLPVTLTSCKNELLISRQGTYQLRYIGDPSEAVLSDVPPNSVVYKIEDKMVKPTYQIEIQCGNS